MPPKKKIIRKAPARSPKDKAAPVDHLAAVEGHVVEIDILRKQVAGINDEIKVHQEAILEAFSHTDQKSRTYQAADGTKHTATHVQSSSVVLDEGKLKTKVGAQMWNKITTRVLDKKKLDAFIASNEIPVAVVAACSEEHPKAAYVKITVK